MYHPVFRKHARAFTLIEMLSAIAVLVMLSAFLFSMLNETSKIWQRAQSQIGPRQNGRAILDYMARDLRCLAQTSDRTSKTGLQLLVNPSTISSSYLNPGAIFWQAPLATVTTSGKLAEIGYFIRWDKTTPSNPKAILCRFLVNPSDTSNYLIYTNPTEWLSNALLDTVAPGTQNVATPANSFKGWFADNVIGLWVRPLYWNPQTKNWAPIIQHGSAGTPYSNYAYDSRLGYSYSYGGSTFLKSGYVDTATSTDCILNTIPGAIEIVIVMLDATAAKMLTSVPAYNVTSPPTIASFWSDINSFVNNLPSSLRSSARVYSSIVQLQSDN